jgi:hypothetical protein
MRGTSKSAVFNVCISKFNALRMPFSCQKEINELKFVRKNFVQKIFKTITAEFIPIEIQITKKDNQS